MAKRKPRAQAAKSKTMVKKSNVVKLPVPTPVRNETSALVSRNRLAAFLGKSHNGDRSLYEVCGYSLEVRTEELWAMYQRNDIAHRIIKAFPSATWRDKPALRDEEGNSAERDTEGYSVFCEACENYFEDKRVWNAIERADRLASIGRFGVLFLGLDDNTSPRLPAPSKAKVMFLQPYGELGVTVAQWETNVKSPRFGLPVMYTLNAAAAADNHTMSPKRGVTAHWTRVIHISENLDQDDIFGTPRLLPVYNRLKDLEKVVGGSAEAFWLLANRGLSVTLADDASPDPAVIADMKLQADEYVHNLRRFFVGQGVNVSSLGAETSDPQYIYQALIELVAGGVGIPKRILVGTERGELASGQDENNWATRTGERRKHFATPVVLQPLVNRLIAIGELPQPRGKWWVEWPEVVTQDPVVESTIALNKTNALSAYANSADARIVVPPQEFRKAFLGLPPESEYDVEGGVLEPVEEDPVPPQLDEYGNPIQEVDKETGEPIDEEVPDELKENMRKQSLYVRRDVINVPQLAKWARSQGLTLQEGAHVTIMYSKATCDWSKMAGWGGGDESGELKIPAGGPRQMSIFGPNSDGEYAVVLEFENADIRYRHDAMAAGGAVHSFPEFCPHITIQYTRDDALTPEDFDPYTGPLVLGPEIFEEVQS